MFETAHNGSRGVNGGILSKTKDGANEPFRMKTRSLPVIKIPINCPHYLMGGDLLHTKMTLEPMKVMIRFIQIQVILEKGLIGSSNCIVKLP